MWNYVVSELTKKADPVTNLVASAFDPGVYGALANVAAITTALQSIVALLALQRGLDLANVGGSRPTAESAAAKRAASRNFWGQGVLNLVALFVNAAVLAAWFKVGVVPYAPSNGNCGCHAPRWRWDASP